MSDPAHEHYPFDFSPGTGHMDVVDRLYCVRDFNLDQCRAALNNKALTLQKTVRIAIERRIRKLEAAR